MGVEVGWIFFCDMHVGRNVDILKLSRDFGMRDSAFILMVCSVGRARGEVWSGFMHVECSALMILEL